MLTNGLEDAAFSKITAKYGKIPGVFSISSTYQGAITEYLNSVEQEGIAVYGNTLAAYTVIRCIHIR